MGEISNCQLINLPKISDPRGNLTFIERSKGLPFDIKRIFYIYDVPTEASRGAHSHKELEQILICLSGSFDVEVSDGTNKKIFHLNRPWIGLYIPPMIWAAELNFDHGTICLVLTSAEYNESDYIRNFTDYKKLMA